MEPLSKEQRAILIRASIDQTKEECPLTSVQEELIVRIFQHQVLTNFTNFSNSTIFSPEDVKAVAKFCNIAKQKIREGCGKPPFHTPPTPILSLPYGKERQLRLYKKIAEFKSRKI